MKSLFKRTSAQDHYVWIQAFKSEKVQINVAFDADLAQQIAMIDLKVEDLQILKSVKPHIEKHMKEVVDAFYQTTTKVEKLKKIIQDNNTVEQLRKTLTVHLIEMFDGTIDEVFIGKRHRIAQVHQRIGLDPKWYLCAFQNLQNALMKIVYREVANQQECIIITTAINKMLSLEQQIVLEAYEKENLEILNHQFEIQADMKRSISGTSQELAALTQQTSASTEELVATSSDVNNSFLHSVANSKETADFASAGHESMRVLKETIMNVKDKTLGMDKIVGQLADSSTQIGNIIGLVQDISSQTKLLSLNASIEAARAGEHGKGFSVVAAEVQKLAENTRVAAEEISNLISESNDYTRLVVTGIKEVHALISDGEIKSQETAQMFENIIRSMKSNIDQIELVESDIRNLVKIIEEIGMASQKVTASAEHLSHLANTD